MILDVVRWAENTSALKAEILKGTAQIEAMRRDIERGLQRDAERTDGRPKLPEGSLLTTGSVARRLGLISTERIRQLRRAGRLIPVYTTPSGVALYDEEDVEAFARAREKTRSKGAA